MEAVSNPIVGVSETTPSTTTTLENETQSTVNITNPREAFIEKCLHPPSATASFEGLPTNDSRTQVCTNWVHNFLLENPLVAGALNDVALQVLPETISGYAILSTTGMRFPAMVFVKHVDGSPLWRQDVQNTYENDVYDVNNIWKDANLFRPCYASLTTYLNATAFNDIGMVSCAQFNPAILFTGNLPAFMDQHSSKAHKFLMQLIADGGYFLEEDDWDFEVRNRYKPFFYATHEEANMLRLNTIDHIRKFGKQYRNHVIDFNRKPYRITPDMEFQIINFAAQGNNISGNFDGAIVPTTSQLMNSSTRSFSSPAKDGSFSVQRLNNVSPKWYATAHNQTVPSPNGLYECWYSFVDPAGNDNFKRFVHADGTGRTRTCLDTFWSDDMTWTWTVYDGLVPNTNISLGTASAQLLQLKMYRGYEIQPAARSPWAGMQKLAPMPDVMAMQKYERAMWLIKDGTIAANNFASTILRGVGKIAAKVIKPLAKGALHGAANAVGSNTRGRKKKKVSIKEPRGRSASKGRSKSRPRTATPAPSSRKKYGIPDFETRQREYRKMLAYENAMRQEMENLKINENKRAAKTSKK
nr:hypothetical protein [Hepelivirales sp.]